MAKCPSCAGKQAGMAHKQGAGDTCGLLNAAFVFAGLAMMLNIRLSYSSAPYALIRFQLPENLFSVFVRRMASALELWCLPSMLLGNIMELALKTYYKLDGYQADTGNNGGDNLVKGGDFRTPRLAKLIAIIAPSILTQWLNFLTYVILLVVYRGGGDQGHVTRFYFVIAISGVVFGINMVLLYAADFNYLTVYIAGENCFPALTSFIHYLTTLMFGNRRKWNSDYVIVYIDIGVAIIISFVAAVLWTLAYGVYVDNSDTNELKHIFTFGFTDTINEHMISPFLMIVVGMGLVYAIYPGIAPGMIVPFYLIDKIEMVLLIATIFPPMIVVILQIVDKNSGYSATKHSPKYYGGWEEHSLRYWHIIDVLIVVKISLAAIFIYSLHYRESSLSRAIINQPKMSTFLSITFYMCHEFLLAIGFAGQISNAPEYVLIPQYIGALFMIFLAFYSEGYIIEYKSHDPDHWPTTGMTPWNAFCYCRKIPIKITNVNLSSFFTTDIKGVF
ncbi:Tpr-related protein family member, putative [Theileria annulata]|uniref:Tpr-related protein family member, putative n=1 Tax=Theileria annulata TaxID=5874 RepID=Q4UHV0_THEAN|nr:Tpr-related protein family member, putative [Theileria annulata]CAI73339.1 Tpr-related protein family member, putative [Theileria annulata]|eukprot:XP_954016.1 Tpr-related protein family member, putative [Theileria annulata]